MSRSCQPPYGRRSNTRTQVAAASRTCVARICLTAVSLVSSVRSRRCPQIKIGELRVLARLGRHLDRPVMRLDDDVMAKRKPEPRAFPPPTAVHALVTAAAQRFWERLRASRHLKEHPWAIC